MGHGVSSISDSVRANGVTRKEEYMLSSCRTPYHNAYKWQLRHHIYKTDYTIWRKLLKFIFSGRNNEICTRLDPLILKDITTWLTAWDWFIATTGEFLYFWEAKNSRRRHLKVHNKHRKYNVEFSVARASLKEDVSRATVTKEKYGWQYMNYSSRYQVG